MSGGRSYRSAPPSTPGTDIPTFPLTAPTRGTTLSRIQVSNLRLETTAEQGMVNASTPDHQAFLPGRRVEQLSVSLVSVGTLVGGIAELMSELKNLSVAETLRKLVDEIDPPRRTSTDRSEADPKGPLLLCGSAGGKLHVSDGLDKDGELYLLAILNGDEVDVYLGAEARRQLAARLSALDMEDPSGD